MKNGDPQTPWCSPSPPSRSSSWTSSCQASTLLRFHDRDICQSCRSLSLGCPPEMVEYCWYKMITIVYLIGPDGWGCWPSLRHRHPSSPQPPTPLLLHPLLPAKPLQDVTKWRSVTISSPPLCPTILLILPLFSFIPSSFGRSWSHWTPLESGWCIQGLRFHVWLKEIWKS